VSNLIPAKMRTYEQAMYDYGFALRKAQKGVPHWTLNRAYVHTNEFAAIIRGYADAAPYEMRPAMLHMVGDRIFRRR
jgi:hypothetical protein